MPGIYFMPKETLEGANVAAVTQGMKFISLMGEGISHLTMPVTKQAPPPPPPPPPPPLS